MGILGGGGGRQGHPGTAEREVFLGSKKANPSLDPPSRHGFVSQLQGRIQEGGSHPKGGVTGYHDPPS